eukprot:GHVU01078599.1.p1 GENE.GHVU01078599.1~~GHVU01078599.1.p1  ORF type:complete len:441 (+),score=59.34 GHVU01078599.1:122-1324(+)
MASGDEALTTDRQATTKMVAFPVQPMVIGEEDPTVDRQATNGVATPAVWSMATGEDASTVDQGTASAVEAKERVPSVVEKEATATNRMATAEAATSDAEPTATTEGTPAAIHWVPTEAETAALVLMAKEEAAVVPSIIGDRDTHTLARWLTRKGGGVDDYIVEFIHLRTATGGEALTNSATASDRLHPVVTDPDQPPNTLPYDIRREMEMPPHLIYLLMQLCGHAVWTAHPPAHERWLAVREKQREGAQLMSATYRQRIAPPQARSDDGEKRGFDERTEGGKDESNVLGTGGTGEYHPPRGRCDTSTKKRNGAGEAPRKSASEQGRNTARPTRYTNRQEETGTEGNITEPAHIAVAKRSHEGPRVTTSPQEFCQQLSSPHPDPRVKKRRKRNRIGRPWVR